MNKQNLVIISAMVNLTEIDGVNTELQSGVSLNFTHIARIFGDDFWKLLVLTLVDAKYSMYEQLKETEKFSRLKSTR
jgi:hypothetical protein